MITDMISTAPGFQTSVNIAYDLNNSQKIQQLIPTTAATNMFEDFLLSTDNVSTNRAHILIGAYGKGKSHIVLAILSFLCRKVERDTAALLEKVQENNPELYEYAQGYLSSEKKLLPVIINGSNTSLVQSFMGALYNTLKQNDLTSLMPDTHFQAAANMIHRWAEEYPETLHKFQQASNMPPEEFLTRLANFDVEAYTLFEKIYPSLTAGSEFNPFAGFDVVELYEKVIEKLPSVGYTGIFVVYDEFSKYLESSITKASISDIKMLQDFAEKCNRSGKKQLHLLLISHKEIENYIDVLPKEKVDGWRGVSERFSHVHLHSDFAQIYEIISQAIIKEPVQWKAFYNQNQKRFDDLKQRFSNSFLFADCDDGAFETALVGCYPLHPVTTFILPRLSEKVAQNERTLFTFISGQEPSAFGNVLETLTGTFPLVTPDVLYDYFAPQMRKEVYTSEIHQLYRLSSSILSKFSSHSLHAKIIKTIALIYCLGQFERLAPTVDTILGIYVDDNVSAEAINNTIQELVQKQCVVYLKRSNAYLKLKESSGVDVYQEISDVAQRRSADMTTASLLNAANMEPYAYPIRYNDEKNMTRFFQFVFMDEADFVASTDLNNFANDIPADGVIVGILPSQEEEIPKLAKELLSRTASVDRAVFVLPDHVNDILLHLRNLDAVQVLRENAQGDDLLFDEYDVIYQDLSEVVHRYIAQYTHPETHAAKFYYHGAEKPLYRKAHLSHLLSDICDVVYPNTPIINNEVLNKNHLSTVALNSRAKLLNGLLASPLQPNLGLTGSGQDVSFMRSSLVTTGVLQQNDGIVSLNLKPADENLAAVFATIDEFLQSAKATHNLSFATLYEKLTSPSYGIGMRRSIIPIYLAVVLRKYQKHSSIRDHFNEVELTATLLNKINESPADFSITLEEWTDAKEAYVLALDKLFADYIYDAERNEPGYSYLSIAMGRWYLSLPKYTKELQQIYCGKTAPEPYTPLDGVKRKFLALLKQPSIGALDLLFTRLPKCFGVSETNEELVQQIASAKAFFDQAKQKLEKVLIRDVKRCLCPYAPKGTTLSSAIQDWYESLTPATLTKLYPNGAERIFSVIAKTTNDEHTLVEGLARVLVGLRIDDWRDNSISIFTNRLQEYKETIEKENTCSERQTKQPSGASQTNYTVVFVDKNGESFERTFERVGRSKRSDALYNRINNAIREMSHSISPQEKRQVLMEILEKLC